METEKQSENQPEKYHKTIRFAVFLWLVIDGSFIFVVLRNLQERENNSVKYCFRWVGCFAPSLKLPFEIAVGSVLNLIMIILWRELHKQTPKKSETSETE